MVLLPQPESDLSLNIMVCGAEIIRLLNKVDGFITIEDLLNKFLSSDKKRYPSLFFKVLAFMYVLDVIKIDRYRISRKSKQQLTPMKLDKFLG